MKSARWLLAACLWLPVMSVAADEKAQAEVSTKDWSYQAVQDLAGRGLIHGYKDAKFLDGKKLTRFEMAALVKRVIDSLLQIPVPKDARSIAPEAPGTAAARGQGREQPPLGRPLAAGNLARTAEFKESDLGVVKRLADEYSVELAVIGVDLQDAMQRVHDLEGRVETLESSLHDPEGPLQTVISNVARIDKIRFSGYVQARYESFSETREAAPKTPASPSTPGDITQPTVADRFTLRRVRLAVAARPTEKIGVRWQIDGGGPSGTGDTTASVETRDAWIDYFFTGSPATGHTATIGQMKSPFGFEVVQSSSVREAPERARVSRFFFPGERDRGVKIASATRNRVFYEVGVYNGSRPGRSAQNVNDNNNDKDVIGRIRTTLAKRVDLGVSFDFGTSLRTVLATGELPRAGGPPGAANPYENTKRVIGADFQWFVRDGTVLRGEFMWGKAGGTNASGYIVQLIQNVGKKNQFVAKYDWLGLDDRVFAPVGGSGTPVGDAVSYDGTLSNLALGVVHHLDASTRLKLFYEIQDRGHEFLDHGGKLGVRRVPWQGNILRFEVITLF